MPARFMTGRVFSSATIARIGHATVARRGSFRLYSDPVFRRPSGGFSGGVYVVQPSLPDISVVIPAFNAEAHLPEAIASMQQQTLQNIEIIVIDDGSTDNTYELVRRLQTLDPRIVFLSSGENRGVAHARNLGMQAAKGRFIALLDADDIAMPHRLERQYAHFASHPTVHAVGSAVLLMNDGGVTDPRPVRPLCAPRDVRLQLALSCEFFMPSLMIRAGKAFPRGRAFVSQRCEDWDYICRFERTWGPGAVANLPEPLVYYRRHEAQATAKMFVDTLAGPSADVRVDYLESLGVPRFAIDLPAHLLSASCFWPLKIDLGGAPVDARRLEAWYEVLFRHLQRSEPVENIDRLIERMRQTALSRLDDHCQQAWDYGQTEAACG